MEQVYLDCLIRDEIGKSKVGALRRKEFVPAVVYGKGEEPLSIKCDRSQLIKFIHAHHGGENIVITLRISEEDSKKKAALEKPVLIKEMQFEPVKDEILHIDFHRISLTEQIETKVPIVAKGEAIGVKKDSGVLAHILWELEVECLPTEIPENIEIDVTNLEIGQSIYVKDLQIPGGVKVLTDPEAIVLTLEHPKKVEEIVPEAEVEGAAPAEPEVIKEKKDKEEGAEKEEKKEEKKEEAPKEKSK